jgi:soluble lytic murein transglycosylase-like protein
MSRISAIESRISDIEAQANQMAPSAPLTGGADFEQVLQQQMAAKGDTSGSLPPGMTAYVPGSIPSGMAEVQAAAGLPASSIGAAQFEPSITAAASEFGVDPNLIKSVIQQESAFNPKATSHCGAMGLMQLMPDTAKELGCNDAYDSEQNIKSGTKYLKQLLDRFHGDTSLALAAYNSGPGNVEKYNGIPPIPETQNYVKNILGFYAAYKRNG